MRLFVVSEYRNKETQYKEGAVIEVPEAEGWFLLADAPGCFAIERPPSILSIDKPPLDRMIRGKKTK